MLHASETTAWNAATARVAASERSSGGSFERSTTASGSYFISTSMKSTRNIVRRRQAYRICDISETNTLQEVRQAQVIPIPAMPTSIHRWTVSMDFQVHEYRLDFGEHLLPHHSSWRVRDSEEIVRELEGGERQTVALCFKFACFASGEFLVRWNSKC